MALSLAAVGGVALAASPAGAAATGKPGAPTDLTGNPYADGTTTLSWVAPTSTGASALTGYQIAGKQGKPGHPCYVAATVTSCMPVGLKDGKPATFKVRAINAEGAGPYSTPLTLTVGLPDPPTGVKGAAGNGSVTVSWSLPARNNAIISSYTATASPGGATCTAAGALSCTVKGLTNGTPYTFTVTSTNPYGVSLPSAPTSAVTPATVPGVPTGVTVSADTTPNPSAFINFVAPSSGFAAITSYTVEVYDVTTTHYAFFTAPASAATNGYLVTPLKPTDLYEFGVLANNAQGSGPMSTPVAAYPAPPTQVSGSSNGDGTADIAWTASPVTLGNTVSGFTVSSFDLTTFVPGPKVTTGSTAASTVLSGLTIGDLWDVCVAPNQSLLTGQSETCTEFVETPAVPGVPTGVQAVATDDGSGPGAQLYFAAPTTGGGSITGYTAVVDDTTTDTTTTYAVPLADAQSSSSLGEPFAISGLNATDAYTFSVYATNAGGNGSASTPVSAVPVNPTGLTAADDGSGGVNVGWTIDPVTLGATINGYNVTTTDDNTNSSGPSTTVGAGVTTADLPGLNAGDDYQVCVMPLDSVSTVAQSCISYQA